MASAVGAVGNAGHDEGGLVEKLGLFSGEDEINLLVFFWCKDEGTESCFALPAQFRAQCAGGWGKHGKTIASIGIRFRGEGFIGGFELHRYARDGLSMRIS